MLEASDRELSILEEAVKTAKPETGATAPKPGEKFWRLEFEAPRIPRGARRLGFVALYRDPLAGREGHAEIMRGGGDGVIYVKAPYAPIRLFVRFRVKKREYRRQIPFKARLIPEVME